MLINSCELDEFESDNPIILEILSTGSTLYLKYQKLTSRMDVYSIYVYSAQATLHLAKMTNGLAQENFVFSNRDSLSTTTLTKKKRNRLALQAQCFHGSMIVEI